MTHRLIIPGEIEQRIHDYVMAVDSEIAGMGKVRVEEDTGDIVVEDIAIYDQDVTSGTADLSSAAVASFMFEMTKRGESLKGWNLWWHSHDTMGAFFSGIDTGTIDRSTEFDFLVSLVVNKKRERQCRLDTYRPFRMTQLAVQVIAEGTSYAIPEAVLAEVREKVKIKTYAGLAGFTGFGGKASGRERETLSGGFRDDSAGSFSGSSKLSDAEQKKLLSALPKNRELEFGRYDPDEVAVIVEAIDQQLRDLRNAGQKDTPEYREMLDERIDWEVELSAMRRIANEEAGIEGALADYNGSRP